MQGIYGSNTPLAANGQIYGPWTDIAGAGELPYLLISALSDQAGSLQVLESDNPTNPAAVTQLGGGLIVANQPFSSSYSPKKRFVQVSYSNGAAPQGSFQLSVQRYGSGERPSDSRLLDLILREIRIQNLILLQMREGYGSTLNIEPSLDQTQF